MPVPPHEGLRRAVAWLAEQGTWNAPAVEEACRRFDLGPADASFLLDELQRRREAARDAGGGGSGHET